MFFPPNLGITSPFLINARSSPIFHDFPSLLSLEGSRSQFSSRSKVKGYSRISKSRSKSIDFADLSFQKHIQNPTKRIAANTIIHDSIPEHTIMHDSIPEHSMEVFGIVLGRKSPILSVLFHKAMAEHQSSHFQVGPKKSMSKRSASISEGYSRIHHQFNLTTSDDDDQCAAESTSKKSHVKKKDKFIKACKRLFRM